MTALLDLPESLADRFERANAKQRAAAMRALSAERQHQLALALHGGDRPWWFYGRSDQFEPVGEHRFWVIKAGRGWGKTRTGAERTLSKIRRYPGALVCLVGPTFADGRDTMVEGDSGMLSSLSPLELRGGSVASGWNRSIGELFFANGGECKIFSSERAWALRGPQHHFGWGDEPSYWRDVQRGTAKDTTFSNMNIGLRLPARRGWDSDFRPSAIFTMTPRMVPLLKVPDEQLTERPETAGLLQRLDVVITSGATTANLRNLDPTYLATVIIPMIGTTLGLQELDGILLEEVEGALWTREMISRDRSELPSGGLLTGTVTAFDPAGGAGPGRDEHGIVVVSSTGYQNERHFWVRQDASVGGSPDDACRPLILAALRTDSDAIVYEKNQGQDWIPATIKSTFATMLAAGELAEFGDDPRLPALHHVDAIKSKFQRATPVRGMYQQRRVHHVGMFSVLESQMTTWVPDESDSPDRLDALVWGISWLSDSGPARADVASTARRERGGRRSDQPNSRLPNVYGSRGRRN